MADIQTMRARDVVSAKLAYCYLNVGSDRYLMMMAKKLEAKQEKDKQEVAIFRQNVQGAQGYIHEWHRHHDHISGD